VTDLTKDDFDVRDNGRRRPLTFFSSEALPFSVVILLDRSGSMSENFPVVVDAAAAFVAEMRPDDRARIGSFSSEIRLSPDDFTSDQDELTRVLREDLQEIGPSPVWTAIDRSLTALLPMPDRRVVLVFSDGHDSPKYGQVRTSLADLTRRVRVNGIMVYAIGFPAEVSRSNGRSPFDPRSPGRIRFPIPMPGFPPGPSGPGGPRGPSGPGGGGISLGRKYQPPDPGLKDLADATGGGYFDWDDDSTANLRRAFVRVAEELHQQYWLGFAPATLDGRTHEIDVRVKRRGLTVRARQHYVATPPGRLPPSR
jgi:VWFA-related protein